MEHFQIAVPEASFDVLASSTRSQAATMTLSPGETTGGPKNEHEDSDQWMFVLAGRGRARVGLTEVLLEPSTLLLIERGETHEITNIGDEPLRSINFYAPPAYPHPSDSTTEEDS